MEQPGAGRSRSGRGPCLYGTSHTIHPPVCVCTHRHASKARALRRAVAAQRPRYVPLASPPRLGRGRSSSSGGSAALLIGRRAPAMRQSQPPRRASASAPSRTASRERAQASPQRGGWLAAATPGHRDAAQRHALAALSLSDL